MKAVSFYHAKTGALHSNQFLCSDDGLVVLNTPPGHLPIEGHHDCLSKRVDVAAHARYLVLTDQIKSLSCQWQRQAELDAAWAQVLVDYQPPQPSPDHEWDATTKRWQLTAAAQANAAARSAAHARIAALEASQHALVREMLLGSASAHPQLQAIQEEITALQASLT